MRAVTQNIYAFQLLKKNLLQFTKTNQAIVFHPEQTNTLKHHQRLKSACCLMNSDPTWCDLHNLCLTEVLLCLFDPFPLCFFLPLSHAHSCKHTPSLQTPSHCLHTQTCTHTFFWPLPVPYLHLSCCGYLHHKQLQDTGGPLTGKCACHLETVYYQQHNTWISSRVFPGTAAHCGVRNVFFFYRSPASRCLACLLLMSAGFYIIYAFMCHDSCIFSCCCKVIFIGRDNKVNWGYAKWSQR